MSQLESLVASSQQCAALFRLGRDIEAAQVMLELFGELQPFAGRACAEVQQQWAVLLTLMLDCQEVQNWLGLADFLEYELVELLQAGLIG